MQAGYLAGVLAIWCAAAWPQTPHEQLGPPCAAEDLAISCRIDAKERAAAVTIANRSHGSCHFTEGRSADDRLNYEVQATAADGKRLEQRTGTLAGFHSGTTIILDPGEVREEKFPLAALIALPKGGGTFRVRIGRGLGVLRYNTSRLDPSKMIWCACEPTTVIFPPLKE